jgi:glyoxylase-like metal-dependent hydrolase (beta-lactamase superfamily II)
MSSSMRVHHLNCGTLCPRGGALLGIAKMVCHCLLVETPSSGLVLVDTGFGLDDVRMPSRLGPSFTFTTRPRTDESETALRQVERLGFSAKDVRHILCTHLDLDHAGGLPDFPEATVHIDAREQAAALHPPTPQERQRYRAVHFAHGPRWSLGGSASARWYGFEAVRDLPGLPPEILLVPLPGHTRGHAAIAVDTGRGWLLHAGDAYFHRDEIEASPPRCPPLLSLFQRVIEVDGPARRANQARLHALHRAHGHEVRIFCAHDPVSFDADRTTER